MFEIEILLFIVLKSMRWHGSEITEIDINMGTVPKHLVPIGIKSVPNLLTTFRCDLIYEEVDHAL